MNTRIENWQGYDIRFVEVNGEWMAILKDVCDALGLRTNDIAQRLDSSMLERVLVAASNTVSNGIRYDNSVSDVISNDLRSDHLSKGLRYNVTESKPVDHISKGDIGKDLGRKPGENKTRWMLAVNEIGIYEALFASRKLEARKFRIWAANVLCKLRKRVGLEQYQVMEMTRADIQEDIDHILDTLFYDEKTKRLMQSVTVAGGDVEQVPFE